MADLVFDKYRKNGGFGVAPQEPNFRVAAGDETATLSWDIAEKTIVDGQVICEAAGVVIRRSTTGYPRDPFTGDLVIDSTDLTGTYVDTDLANETTYYYRAFPYSVNGVFNQSKYRAKGSAKPSHSAKLYIFYNAAEAVGEEITATDGTHTLTAEIDSNGAAFFEIYDAGNYRVGGQPFTAVLGESTIWNEGLYGFDWDLSEMDTESSITYPAGVDNAHYTPVPDCGSDADIILDSDWSDFFENFIGSRPVMLNFDGTVAYELDHNDQTKKKDGTTSDISDASTSMNAMVEYPKRYFKRYTDANGIAHYRASRLKLNSDYKAFPWMYGNTEVTAFENDFIYLPMFEGSSVSSKVRSIAGKAPMNTQTGATEWTQIQALGAGWIFDDEADSNMVYDYMFLMARSTDVQRHWGQGHNSGGSQASHLHNTGLLKSHGPFYGGTGNTDMKWGWHENYYGDRWERTFGVYLINSVLYVKDFPPYTTDGSVTNYTSLGRGIGGTSGGYISEYTYDEHGFKPKTASGATGKYVPDGAWFASGTMFLVRGGCCNNGALDGRAFCVSPPFSHSVWSVGPSPAYKNPVAA